MKGFRYTISRARARPPGCYRQISREEAREFLGGAILEVSFHRPLPKTRFYITVQGYRLAIKRCEEQKFA